MLKTQYATSRPPLLQATPPFMQATPPLLQATPGLKLYKAQDLSENPASHLTYWCCGQEAATCAGRAAAEGLVHSTRAFGYLPTHAQFCTSR